MNAKELERLQTLEQRIHEIAKESGLITMEIDFEVVSARRMLEAMSYRFPNNISHWTFGRDFDKNRTIYEHTGGGIPYEQVWNFERPRALLVANNPFALNVLVIAHVYGHVDFFLGSEYLKRGRSFSDIAEEVRYASERFREYESKYGAVAVEEMIDAALSIQWQQPSAPFLDEPNDNESRRYCINLERERIKYAQKHIYEMGKEKADKEIADAEKQLKLLAYATPPAPVYDLLKYLIECAPRLRQWERDILSVVRNQARALAPNMRTKMLNEGWATYWHTRIMRQLFSEGLLTEEEHGVFADFHAKVTQASKANFNVYNIGLAIFEDVEERFNAGRFGGEYEECSDPIEKSKWNTGVMKGREKIFSIRTSYTDRMAVEELFIDEFIRERELYLYDVHVQESTGDKIFYVKEKNPSIIRQLLKESFTFYDIMPIAIINGDYNGQGILLLRHDYSGVLLDETYVKGTIEHIYRLWQRPVYLETENIDGPVTYQFDGKRHEKDK